MENPQVGVGVGVGAGALVAPLQVSSWLRMAWRCMHACMDLSVFWGRERGWEGRGGGLSQGKRLETMEIKWEFCQGGAVEWCRVRCLRVILLPGREGGCEMYCGGGGGWWIGGFHYFD